MHYMPGQRLTQSQYTHQKNIKHFGDLIVQLDNQALTHISRVVGLFIIRIGIGDPLNRYISTGLLPYEEYSEDWFFPSKAEFSALRKVPELVKGLARVLLNKCQEVES